MEAMPFLLLSFLIHFGLSPAFAGEATVTIVRETPVYATPSNKARPAVFLKEGEVIVVIDNTGEYRKVKVKRAGKWRTGFISSRDADQLSGASGAVKSSHPERRWGAGLGLGYDHLSQTGRNFETEDQVQYTTSAYVSQAIIPSINLQMYDENFWRLSFGYKTTHYLGQAVTNIGGGAAKPIEVNHKMLSALLQKAFNPLPWKFLYAGAGVSAAKATAVEILLEGKKLTTSDSEKPTYFGIQGFAGMQFFLLDKVSIAGEARLTVIPNQVPMIYEYEFVGCLLYWM